MTRMKRRLLSCLLALVLVVGLAPVRGRAVLQGVYFTAANEQLLELSSATMPFWSGDTLYVASSLFDGTDLGVSYVRNNKMGLAMLYTSRTDLRFSLTDQTVTDKQGNRYTGRAIERGGVVFFPLNLVCTFFGLSWSYNATDTAPLIRVRSSSVILDDRTFIDAAGESMDSRYAAYEKWAEANAPQVTAPVEEPGSAPVHAAEGQRVCLVVESRTAEDTLAVLGLLGDSRATFLLDVEQLENGDLVRAIVSGGHQLALLPQAETAEQLEAEIALARERLWQAACCWLNLVWSPTGDWDQVLEAAGCRALTATLDRSESGLGSAARATGLLNVIGRYRRDVTVLLGPDRGCTGGLSTLLRELLAAQYHVCAVRLAP